MKKTDPAGRSKGNSADETGGSGGGPSFEAAMKRLAEIVERLESGELPLDESLKLFEEGALLSKRASTLLDQFERRVEVLTRAADGTLGSEPLRLETETEEE